MTCNCNRHIMNMCKIPLPPPTISILIGFQHGLVLSILTGHKDWFTIKYKPILFVGGWGSCYPIIILIVDNLVKLAQAELCQPCFHLS